MEKNYVAHNEKASHLPQEVAEISEMSNKLENPLAGKDKAELEKDAVAFCNKHGLNEHGMSLKHVIWAFNLHLFS